MNPSLFQGLVLLVVAIILSLLVYSCAKSDQRNEPSILEFLGLEDFGTLLLAFFAVVAWVSCYNKIENGLFPETTKVISPK